MRTTALLLIGLAVGWVASGVEGHEDAYAQNPAEAEVPRAQRDGVLRRRGILPSREAPAPTNTTDAPPFVVGESVPAPASPVGRYQISAYGSPSGHGCYVVDTMSGKTWHIANGQPPEVVASSLNSQAAPTEPLLLPEPSIDGMPPLELTPAD